MGSLPPGNLSKLAVCFRYLPSGAPSVWFCRAPLLAGTGDLGPTGGARPPGDGPSWFCWGLALLPVRSDLFLSLLLLGLVWLSPVPLPLLPTFPMPRGARWASGSFGWCLLAGWGAGIFATGNQVWGMRAPSEAPGEGPSCLPQLLDSTTLVNASDFMWPSSVFSSACLL